MLEFSSEKFQGVQGQYFASTRLRPYEFRYTYYLENNTN